MQYKTSEQNGIVKRFNTVRRYGRLYRRLDLTIRPSCFGEKLRNLLTSMRP
jgi:hypothetical protein